MESMHIHFDHLHVCVSMHIHMVISPIQVTQQIFWTGIHETYLDVVGYPC